MRTKRDLFGYLSFKVIAALSYLLALGSIAKKRVLRTLKNTIHTNTANHIIN